MTDDQTQQQPSDDEPREDEAGMAGPDVSELDDDPAYNPDDEGLKDLKGG